MMEPVTAPVAAVFFVERARHATPAFDFCRRCRSIFDFGYQHTGTGSAIRRATPSWSTTACSRAQTRPAPRLAARSTPRPAYAPWAPPTSAAGGALLPGRRATVQLGAGLAHSAPIPWVTLCGERLAQTPLAPATAWISLGALRRGLHAGGNSFGSDYPVAYQRRALKKRASNAYV